MIFDLKATKIEITDAIRAAIEKKLKTLDTKVARFGEAVQGRVEVCKTTKHHKKGEVFHAAIFLRLPGFKIMAEAMDNDLYVAIGSAKKEAERQVVEYKGRLVASQKRGARKAKRTARRLPGDKRERGGRVLDEGV